MAHWIGCLRYSIGNQQQNVISDNQILQILTTLRCRIVIANEQNEQVFQVVNEAYLNLQQPNIVNIVLSLSLKANFHQIYGKTIKYIDLNKLLGSNAIFFCRFPVYEEIPELR